ncbi:hypothetical protein F0237_21870 [Vibrio tubiashii]|uniref:Uncharacterized protein n=1 Tax=Vibrio tubiashii TaxID=29498 RepID=A0AAE5EWG9_9VIBR|nr:hypothetical protein [Vibrio tubiashii]NOI83310.1 hypothetical protein [Vibrio tubiashii]
MEEYKIVEVCMAHLTTAIKTGRDIEAVTGDHLTQANIITPILILGCDLLTPSEQFNGLAREMANYAMQYSYSIAESHAGSVNKVSPLTDELERFVGLVMASNVREMASPTLQ